MTALLLLLLDVGPVCPPVLVEAHDLGRIAPDSRLVGQRVRVCFTHDSLVGEVNGCVGVDAWTAPVLARQGVSHAVVLSPGESDEVTTGLLPANARPYPGNY